MKKLAGRTAVVTGASKGLGKAIAMALAAEGARLALVARDSGPLEAVAGEISGAGGEAACFPADVANEEQVRAIERMVLARFGTVHILVNNAGINLRRPVEEFTLDEWRRVMDTNVTGAFLMCRSFVPAMKGQGYGRIVNLSSIMSHVSLPQRSAYATSKTALLGLTRTLALELAADAITVNGISPGPFDTEMNESLTDEARAQFVAGVPLGRWGKVEEVGALAVFLCSDEAGFITGTDIIIDGGWCAR
jgi:NAD(P)-dependent dehydrogenase (short-subunit alcohol dehydrogenase family)